MTGITSSFSPIHIDGCGINISGSGGRSNNDVGIRPLTRGESLSSGLKSECRWQSGTCWDGWPEQYSCRCAGRPFPTQSSHLATAPTGLSDSIFPEYEIFASIFGWYGDRDIVKLAAA